LTAAGYRVEEVLPPDIEEAARLWHAIGSNDVFRLLKPSIEQHGDAPARTSLREWLTLYPPTDPLAALDALARRDLLLWRWLEFFDDHPLIVLPTHCDLPPPWGEDQTRAGQRRLLQALRVGLIAPLLGLAGLALPVGAYGGLRTGGSDRTEPFSRGLRARRRRGYRGFRGHRYPDRSGVVSACGTICR
jgi:amidase